MPSTKRINTWQLSLWLVNTLRSEHLVNHFLSTSFIRRFTSYIWFYFHSTKHWNPWRSNRHNSSSYFAKFILISNLSKSRSSMTCVEVIPSFWNLYMACALVGLLRTNFSVNVIKTRIFFKKMQSTGWNQCWKGPLENYYAKREAMYWFNSACLGNGIIVALNSYMCDARVFVHIWVSKLAENWKLSWSPFCRQRHRSLSIWQPPVPLFKTNLASCQLTQFTMLSRILLSNIVFKSILLRLWIILM